MYLNLCLIANSAFNGGVKFVNICNFVYGVNVI